MEAERGRFIVLEGIDGTGKSTLSEVLGRWLRDRGIDVHLTCEPTRTWLGDAVRRSWSEGVDPRTEALLFVADRKEHTDRITARLETGQWVISDRYRDSSCAYQGAYLAAEMGLSGAAEWVDRLNALVAVEPDLGILLDASPETTLGRLGKRGRLEKYEEGEYLETVRDIYLLLAERKGRKVVDCSRPQNEVAEACWALLEPLLP